jgi:hypothetical protein
MTEPRRRRLGAARPHTSTESVTFRRLLKGKDLTCPRCNARSSPSQIRTEKPKPRSTLWLPNCSPGGTVTMPRSLDRHLSDDVVVAHVARLAVDANGAPQPPANSLTACRAEITLVIGRADSAGVQGCVVHPRVGHSRGGGDGREDRQTRGLQRQDRADCLIRKQLRQYPAPGPHCRPSRARRRRRL